MNKKLFYSLTSILILLSIFFNILANNDFSKEGTISGQVQLDSIWQPVAYLSHIATFNAMYSMSNDMILEEAKIDSQGFFSFNLKFLPKEDNLYRIHFVKKGDPPASIIIGGREENHFFVIANRNSSFKIQNLEKQNLIHNFSIIGSPINSIFEQISEIGNYIDSSFNVGTSIKKEFIKTAIEEKFRSIADTCSTPLLSLYSVYKSNFESNYVLNKEFYNSYSKKWKWNNSSYFKAFREQLPKKGNNETLYRFLIALIFVLIGFWLGRQKIFSQFKNLNLSQLSVQERKIFILIQQGMSNQEISDECNISLSTVKSHVSGIYSKLKIKSRKEALNILS